MNAKGPLLKILTVLVSVLMSGAALSQESRDQMIYIGDCQLISAPENAQSFNFCQQGEASVEYLLSSHEKDVGHYVSAEVYSAAHFFSFASLHYQGEAIAFIPNNRFESVEREGDSNLVALRLGNSILHKVRLTAGKVQLPFGLDDNRLSASLRRLERDEFWQSPPYGGYVTLDNLINFQIDLGVSQGKITGDNNFTSDEPDLKAASLRMMYDTSLLLGSRFIASLYGEKEGLRRYGLAILNSHYKAGESHIEWVRFLQTPDGQVGEFSQMIRFSYLSPIQREGQWGAHYEFVRFYHRMGSLSFEQFLAEFLSAKLTISYQKSETSSFKSRWLGTLGLNFEL